MEGEDCHASLAMTSGSLAMTSDASLAKAFLAHAKSSPMTAVVRRSVEARSAISSSGVAAGTNDETNHAFPYA